MELLPRSGEGSVHAVPLATAVLAPSSTLGWLDQSLLFTECELLNTTLRGLSATAPASWTVLSNGVSWVSCELTTPELPFRVWGPRCRLAPPVVRGWVVGVDLLFWLTPGALPGTFLPLNRKATELRVSAGEERGMGEQ